MKNGRWMMKNGIIEKDRKDPKDLKEKPSYIADKIQIIR